MGISNIDKITHVETKSTSNFPKRFADRHQTEKFIKLLRSQKQYKSYILKI